MNKAEKLKKLDNQKLMDVVKNYKQYGYEVSLREQAIAILGERGITKEQLQIHGYFENHTYERAKEVYHAFVKNSNRAFILYLLLVVGQISVFFVSGMGWGGVISIAYLIAIIAYFVFLLKSFLNQAEFDKLIGEKYTVGSALFYVIFGFVFYLVLYFLFKSQMKEKLQTIL